MSSMRNAVSRRNHKERSQPEARSKWGLLEKHKDYSLRAKDYNQKKQKLNILSQKTRERHPDEFAFGMLSADKGLQGKHGRGDQDKNRLSHDAVKLLKTQDSGYLRVVAARGRKEIDRLQEEVSIGGVVKSKVVESKSKLVFDENGLPPVKKRRLSDSASDDSAMMDVTDITETDGINGAVVAIEQEEERSESEDITRKSQSKKQLQKARDTSTKMKVERRRRKLLRERRAAKLVELQKRQKDILAAADQLELQRAKMARTIGGTNRNGVKFKIRERKR